VTLGGITAASIFAAVIGLQLGAFCVVLETHLSGVAELPFSAFVLLMQPIHLVIGFVEGIVTAAILGFVYKMRPEIMECVLDREAIKSSINRKVIIAFAVIALFAGGVLSQFASSNPDGLEWAIQKVAGD